MIDKKLRKVMNLEMPLKIFFFIIKTTELFSDEQVEIALGYDVDQAYDEVLKTYESYPWRVRIKPAGSVNATRVLDVVDPSDLPQTEQKMRVMTDKDSEDYFGKTPNLLSYINSLEYASDNFSEILNATDKKDLKRIIKKLGKKIIK